MKLRLIVFLVVSGAAISLAQTPAVVTPPQTRAARMAAIKGRVAKALGLSTAQKQQIKTIRQQAKLTAEPVVGKLKQNRAALTTAIKAGDAAQIQALSKTQGELLGQSLSIRSQARAQIYAGLTNDQRTKLDAIQARIQAKLTQRKAAKSAVN